MTSVWFCAIKPLDSAVTNGHTFSGLKQHRFIPYSSGGQRPPGDKIKALDFKTQGSIPSRRSRGRIHILAFFQILEAACIPWLVTPLSIMDFPGGSDGKESACHAGDTGSVRGSGRSPGEVNGYPLQYSCLGNSMDKRACQALIHGVEKSQTRLSD